MAAPVRPARSRDLAVLRDIERAAGQRYREYGLDRVADDEPASIEELAGYVREGRAWVAVDDGDRPLGYVVVEVVDDAGHIEQVSVMPEHQSRGIGRALIEQVASWASAMGFASLTLTTFSHIPWNQPLYEHLGFRVLSPDEITPGVEAIRQAEAKHGLDPELRVVMGLVLHD